MNIITRLVLLALVFATTLAFGFGWRDIVHGESPNLKVLPGALFGRAKSESELIPARSFTEALSNIDAFFYGSPDRQQLVYAGVQGMISSLGDPHTVLLEPEVARQFDERNHGRFVGIGAELMRDALGARVRTIFKNSPAERRGLKSGDVITEVEGAAVAGRDLNDVVRDIRGEEGTRVTLTVFREEAKRTLKLTIERRQVQIQEVYAKVLDDAKPKLGYIQIRSFSENVVSQFDEEMRDLEDNGIRGLVIDLRGNPGGRLDMAVDMTSRFLDNKLITTMRKRDGRSENFYSRSGLANRRYPVAILIDEGSASASEIFAGAMRDWDMATLVGEHTYGKGSVQVIRPLSDGAQLKVTIASYYLPSKESVHRREDSEGNYLSGGIQPDVTIALDAGAMLGEPENDSQLRKSMEVLRSKLR